jgi:CO dehydrogenase nickel-insertion accessory protein CooC1
MGKRNISVIGSIPYNDAIFNADLEGRALSMEDGHIAQALKQIVDSIL